ncbi:MAG: hypothetical protein GX903_05920 [Spirochaetales bacterium]|nr:hypothetical protein [Spirochaetales bacterium]
MSYGYYKQGPSVAEKRVKAQKWIASQLRKKVDITPVEEGCKPGTTWWGKAWCNNLERYADFSNRVTRGRSYVKNGFVVDFKFVNGVIVAKVLGSRAKPYDVQVVIEDLSEEKLQLVEKQCTQKLDSLETLLSGKFPEDLKNVYFEYLFPTPREIKFYCSCPDSAYMCKHVSAVLYAIACRVDSDPLFFFALRGIDTAKLLAKSIDDKVEDLLSNVTKTSKRALADEDTDKLFGL